MLWKALDRLLLGVSNREFVVVALGQWQGNGEAGSFSGRAVHLDPALVRVHDPAHEAQAQPEPFFFRPSAFGAIETIEDVRQVFRRDADAGVLDGQPRRAVDTFEVYIHSPARLGVLDRVRNKVGD